MMPVALACLVLLATAGPAAAQGTGFAGSNWFETQTPQDAQWVAEMLPPGGSFTLRYRADKYVEQPPSTLGDVIQLASDLAAAGKGLRVIYTAGMDVVAGESPADLAADNLAGVQTLLDGGVDVIAVEAGNEEYAGVNFDFDFAAYRAVFEPTFSAIHGAYPSLPFSIFLAPRPRDSDGDGNIASDPDDILGGRTDHAAFNAAVVAFLAGADEAYAVSVHWYFGDDEAPVTVAEPPKYVFNPDNPYPDLDAYFEALYQQGAASTLWPNSLAYLQRVVPTRGAYITEFGFSNASGLKNTMGYSMVMWRVWNTWRTAVVESQMFNGISPSGNGMIFPATPKDLNPAGYVNLRRLDYWLYTLLGGVPLATPELPAVATLADPGTHRWWFTNPGGAFVPAFTMSGVTVRSARVHYVQGQHWYSSAGVCEWMENGSVANYEIDGTESTVVAGALPEIPALSFGYVELELDEITDAYAGYSVTAPAVDAVGAVIPANDFPDDWVLTFDDVLLDDTDADDPENFVVTKPRTLFVPAALDGAPGVAWPDRKGIVYQAKQGSESTAGAVPPFERPERHMSRLWQLTNQLGTIAIVSKKLAHVVVPATASLASAPPAAPDATHRACYSVQVTKDVTAQTPETTVGSGIGRFDTDLQTYFRGGLFDDCALNEEGTPSFPGTPVAGACLVNVGKPRLLCNPVDTAAVVPPRESSAVVVPSAARTATSLLCYKAKLAKRFTHAPAAMLAGATLDATIDPAQARHEKRRVQAGTGIYLGPGNQFPGPAEVSTTKLAFVCLPTSVESVAPAP
ncbi:MAG: hypothetical protein IT293_08395 [Deltaproteobacteria bacterium]|nr:hypothetical protein [Deltaproteobacteria bacterium]